MNIFYLLTFLLVSLGAFYSLRALGITPFSACCASLLYTFLPYHFLRGTGHLLLCSYFMVPIVLSFILRLLHDPEPVIPKTNQETKSFFRSPILWGGIIICALASSTGIYYAFFSCYFLTIAFLILFVTKTNTHRAKIALFFITIISAGVIANFTPSILHRTKNGKNPAAVKRAHADSEVYALKITQLIFPNATHRNNRLARFMTHYNANSPLINENNTASLGIAGTIGFLALLIWLFVSTKMSSAHPLLAHLSAMNLAAIFLGTVGGGGALFGWLISPQIRAYNRISVFIAFFCIAFLAYAVDRLLERSSSIRFVKPISLIAVSALTALALIEQTSPSFVPPYHVSKAASVAAKNYFTQIEKRLPPGSMIFQLPYMPFPETSPVFNVADYELLVPYLHTEQLHWSYGSMKGRQGDVWQREAAAKPLPDFLKSIYSAGFRGLLLNRNGYPDNGVSMIRDLSRLLNTTPIQDNVTPYVFFDLAPLIGNVDNKPHSL